MSKIEKYRKRIFIGISFGFFFLGLLFSILHLDSGVELYGVTEKTEENSFNLNALYEEEWQSQYTTNYHNNFPFRALMVKINNQFLYQLRSIINGSIVVGKDGWLFSDEYIQNAFTDASDNVKEQIDIYVDNLLECQQILNGQKKELVYIITPSKTEIYPEFLPERYQALVTQRQDLVNAYDYLAYKLSQTDIKTIDMTKSLKETEGVYPYFCKTGTHWNYYAASLGAQELLKALGDTVTDFEVISSNQPFETEQDLYLLSNIWNGKKEALYYKGIISIEQNSDKRTVLEMGTSFSNEMVTELINKDGEMIFDNYIRYQYFVSKSIYSGDRTQVEAIAMQTENNLLDEISNADIIVIENNNSYVPDSHMQFVQYIIDNKDIIKTRQESIEPIIFDNDAFIIDFCQGGNADSYIKTGFYDAEEACRWSTANTKIELYLQKDSDLRLDFSANSFCEKTKIMFNNNLLWDSEKDSIELLNNIVIPKKLILEGEGNYLQVITSKEILSSKEQGAGDDTRKLAQYWNKLLIIRGTSQ